MKKYVFGGPFPDRMAPDETRALAVLAVVLVVVLVVVVV